MVSGEESVSVAVRDGAIEGVKEAVGASSVFEVGTVVDVEVAPRYQKVIVVLVAAVLANWSWGNLGCYAAATDG